MCRFSVPCRFSFLLPALLLGFAQIFLLGSQPAQGWGWSGRLVPSTADGTPLPSNVTWNTGYLPMGGTMTGLGAAGGQSIPTPPYFEYSPSPPGGNWIYVGGSVPCYSYDFDEPPAISALALCYLYYDWIWDDPGPLQAISDYAQGSASVSLSACFVWQTSYSSPTDDPPPASLPPPPPPAVATFLIRTSLLAQHSLLTGTLSGSASVRDQYGDQVVLNVEDPASTKSGGGSHLVQASKQMVGDKAVYTVNLTGTLDAFAANDHSYSGGAGGYAKLNAGVKHDDDNRSVTIDPLGHEVTYKKGFLKDANGNYTIINGQKFDGPEANSLIGNTLPVDIGISLKPFAESIDTWYTVTYQPNVSQQTGYPDTSVNAVNEGDSFDFSESLKGGSQSGTLPIYNPPFGSTYTMPPIVPSYHKPYIYYDPLPWPNENDYDTDHPHLVVADADGTDKVGLTYHFVQDGSIADYHLAVQLHQIYENWNIISTQDDADPPYENLDCTPSNQIHGQPVNVERGKATDNLMAFAYQGGSASLIAIAALMAENPYAAALVAVGSYITDKAAPEAEPSSVNDALSDWATSVAATQQAKQPDGTYSSDALISPPDTVEFFDANNVQQNAEYWGMSSWTLVRKTYWRNYNWQADQYGGLGYVGIATTQTKQVVSQPEFHMYSVNIPPPPPPPAP